MKPLKTDDHNAPRWVRIGPTTYAVLQGEVVGLPNRLHTRIFCPHCRTWHFHGFDSTNPERTNGHRAAHCGYHTPGKGGSDAAESPFHDTGYFVVLPGTSLRELLRHEHEPWEEITPGRTPEEPPLVWRQLELWGEERDDE